jgi:hypothetical protein
MLNYDKRGLPMKTLRGKNSLYFILLIILTVVLTACASSPDFELYEGKSLRIAVVGEPPVVQEEQVRFTEITFDELTGEEMDSYDAVFIMENNLSEASKSQYADVYLQSTILFFFIATKSHIPFTVESTEYNPTWNWTAGNNYAVGVLTSDEDETLQTWGYGLYNDEKTDENIKGVYSRIFMTIGQM